MVGGREVKKSQHRGVRKKLIGGRRSDFGVDYRHKDPDTYGRYEPAPEKTKEELQIKRIRSLE